MRVEYFPQTQIKSIHSAQTHIIHKYISSRICITIAIAQTPRNRQPSAMCSFRRISMQTHYTFFHLYLAHSEYAMTSRYFMIFFIAALTLFLRLDKFHTFSRISIRNRLIYLPSFRLFIVYIHIKILAKIYLHVLSGPYSCSLTGLH